MNEIEIPPYFLCPISFQIMKAPVSTVTGITYDRENIEKWLMKAKFILFFISKLYIKQTGQLKTQTRPLRKGNFPTKYKNP
jgi:hypothetical protein